jgi:DNA-binding beta-propeller fold protein YncE
MSKERLPYLLLILSLWVFPVGAWAKKPPKPTTTPTATLTFTPTPDASATPTPEELFRVDQVWGSAGDGLDQLNEPQGLFITPDDRMAIADSGNNRILLWTTEGRPIKAIGSFGSSAVWRNPPQFNHPEGVFWHPSNQLFVADTFNHRIVVVDPRGLAVSVWGRHGTEDGAFDQPKAFALGKYGDIWVLDSGNNRLQLFSPQGVFKEKWGSFGSENGQFKDPTAIAINFIEQLPVSDSGNFRLQVVNTDGSSVTTQGWLGDGPNQYREPAGLTILPGGWLAVVDGVNGRVLFYNNRFEYISDWRATKDPSWKLPAPHFRGIAFDSKSRLYLTDIANNVVVRLQPQRKVPVLIPKDTPIPASQQGLYGGQGFPVR